MRAFCDSKGYYDSYACIVNVCGCVEIYLPNKILSPSISRRGELSVSA